MSLTKVGVIYNYNAILAKIGMAGMRKIRNIFTIVHIGHNNTRKQITSFKTIKDGNNHILILPRFSGEMLKKINLVDEIKNNLPAGEDVNYNNMDVILKHNQTIVCNHLRNTIYTPDKIENGLSSTILQMDPGYGKTYVALGVINMIKKKTMIIVPNTYLLKQWVGILTDAFPDNTVGRYYGLKKEDGDIVVTVINSALKFPNGDYNKFGLIVYDEVHMYCSPKFAAIFTTAQSKCCLGITATPAERIDGFDPIAYWALGNVIRADKLEGWNPADVNFVSKVTRVQYAGHKDYTKILESVTGVVSVPLMVNQLQEDPYRNKLIVAHAIRLYQSGRNVFVFSDRREHLHTIARMLREEKVKYEAPELVNEEKEEVEDNKNENKEDNEENKEVKEEENVEGVNELMGGATDAEIEHAKDVGRIIMTTYQYSGTGVSINKMNSIILATPRKSNMCQILGRVYRLTSDQTIQRHIIDIVDSKICLKSQYYTRKKTYINNLHAEIVEKKTKWEECVNVQDIMKTIEL